MKKSFLRPEIGAAFIVQLLALLLFASCDRPPIGKSPEEKGEARFLDSIAELPELGFGRSEPFSFDMKVKAETPERTRSFKANMRVQPDSIFWGSVAPAFGIELARILLSDDSLSFMDRMNDRYYLGEPERMEARLGIPLERRVMESMLLGKPALAYEKGFLLYEGKGDTLRYRPVMDPDLKEVLGIDGPDEDPFDSVELRPRSAGGDSLSRLLDQEASRARYIPFFWTADSVEVMTRFSVIDLKERNVLDLRYLSYQEVDGGRMPSSIKARVRSSKGISTFDVQIDGVNGSRTLSYPFSIPDGYAPIHP